METSSTRPVEFFIFLFVLRSFPADTMEPCRALIKLYGRTQYFFLLFFKYQYIP